MTETTTKTRPHHIALLALFVAIIAGVPVAQAIIDKVVEEEDKPLALTLFERAPTEEHLRAYEKLLEDSSYFEQKVRPWFQLARYRLIGEMGEKALRGSAEGWYFYTPGVRYLVEPYYRDLREKPKDDPVATIVDFARQLKGRGIELLVVPIPGKASIYPDKLVDHGKLVNVSPSAKLAAHPTLRFIAELKRAGINTVNLHNLLWSRRGEAQLYMKADTHWTGDGAKLAAAHIARWIKARPWFRGLAPGAARYGRKRVVVERAGDIPEMTKIPRREVLFAKEKVVCHKVFDKKSGEAYQDPEDPKESSVLLLGDSFSRVFQTDEPEAAGLIANLAYELQQPLSSIVNDGGASTYVRQALVRELGMLAAKRLVIWAFVERDIRFGRLGWQQFELGKKGGTE